MNERAQFVFYVYDGELSITELCEHFGVSRKTGYKWLKRYEKEGLEGLSDRGRTPHRVPNRTKDEGGRFSCFDEAPSSELGSAEVDAVSSKKASAVEIAVGDDGEQHLES